MYGKCFSLSVSFCTVAHFTPGMPTIEIVARAAKSAQAISDRFALKVKSIAGIVSK
jgi:hypothetical protein